VHKYHDFFNLSTESKQLSHADEKKNTTPLTWTVHHYYMSFDLISFFSGKASGLITNLTKTEVFPIRCDDIDITYILSDFPTKVGGFLGNYLGLPLHYKRLRKVHLQSLIDKIGRKLPRWFGKNIARLGGSLWLKLCSQRWRIIIRQCYLSRCGHSARLRRLHVDSSGREMIASWQAAAIHSLTGTPSVDRRSWAVLACRT
jgi:hypothetical protein